MYKVLLYTISAQKLKHKVPALVGLLYVSVKCVGWEGA